MLYANVRLLKNFNTKLDKNGNLNLNIAMQFYPFKTFIDIFSVIK